jgi:arylamine N-acetyltransferase
MCQVYNFGDGKKYWTEMNLGHPAAGHNCVALQIQTVFDFKNTNWIAQTCDNVTFGRNSYVCQKKIEKNTCKVSSNNFHVTKQPKATTKKTTTKKTTTKKTTTKKPNYTTSNTTATTRNSAGTANFKLWLLIGFLNLNLK